MRRCFAVIGVLGLGLACMWLWGCFAPGLAPSPSYVTVRMYIHEGSETGPLIIGARVQGYDAAGNPFDRSTNSSGYAQITGIPGLWHFTVSKTGYHTIAWDQSITQDCQLDVCLEDVCAGETGNIRETYCWWGDYFHKWELVWDIPRYLYCRSRFADVPRSGDFPWYGNAKLVKWPEDDEFILELALAINSPYSDYYERATNTLHFVQALMPYVEDVGDYWQTPVETLVLQKGDCEDGTILLVALLYALRFPVCFGAYWNPITQPPKGHSFGLVQVSQEWVNAHTGPFNKCWWMGCWTILKRTTDGTLWAMAETTVDPDGPIDMEYVGLGCGTIPETATVKIFDVETGADLSPEFQRLEKPCNCSSNSPNLAPKGVSWVGLKGYL